MTEQTALASVVRQAGEGEQRWFFGGGVHTWKVRAADSGGAFLCFEDHMEGGKVTPLHTHPTDESMYVLEGEITVHLDGEEVTVGTGGFFLAPRGVPHAFKVLSSSCRLMCLHTPGSSEDFYLQASEPLAGSTREVDFGKIGAAAQASGGMTIVGPPPFS
ncbi:MAG: cupin domain-containing protein [Mycobacteriales bacterium]